MIIISCDCDKRSFNIYHTVARNAATWSAQHQQRCPDHYWEIGVGRNRANKPVTPEVVPTPPNNAPSDYQSPYNRELQQLAAHRAALGDTPTNRKVPRPPVTPDAASRRSSSVSSAGPFPSLPAVPSTGSVAKGVAADSHGVPSLPAVNTPARFAGAAYPAFPPSRPPHSVGTTPQTYQKSLYYSRTQNGRPAPQRSL
eukprot:NODE_6719_length_624_cov_6.835010_g6696_i0.p1 GENE.NODE_6719_length_624_cov_6.835010_g6696_i0~~NODE_6719_length_624_cov_6.835010_g6696_i0.p1  ORF type:complete len:198 (+),score=10.42 NODE_6719_length_624_cov_6.835010_g6696_i0:21-614(+)